ncbi:hypothetical protein V2G26_003063 [Clonostachys chloroleuca]
MLSPYVVVFYVAAFEKENRFALDRNALFVKTFPPTRVRRQAVEPPLRAANDVLPVLALCQIGSSLGSLRKSALICPVRAACRNAARTFVDSANTVLGGGDSLTPESQRFKLRNAVKIGSN